MLGGGGLTLEIAAYNPALLRPNKAKGSKLPLAFGTSGGRKIVEIVGDLQGWCISNDIVCFVGSLFAALCPVCNPPLKGPIASLTQTYNIPYAFVALWICFLDQRALC